MNREKAVEVFDILLENRKILDIVFPKEERNGAIVSPMREKHIDSLKRRYEENLKRLEELLPNERARKKAIDAFSSLKKSETSLNAFLQKYKELTAKEREKEPKEADVITNAVIEHFAGDIVAVKKEFAHSSSYALIGRIDILFVTKSNEVVSVEVKSKKDNLDRLFRQLYEATRTFDRCYVALDEKHYEKYLKEFASGFYNKVHRAESKRGKMKLLSQLTAKKRPKAGAKTDG